ncbi:MAG: DUF3365 domain-containing protein [Thiogranum sp.]
MKPAGKKLFNIMMMVVLASVCGVSAADELAEREQASRQAAAQLLKQLGGALKKEMGSGGPEAAISVCRDLAPQISGAISRANGWRMTRVSNKVRNPLLGMPDAWELSALSEFEKRAGQGETYQDMVAGEVVEEGGAQYYRFMKAIDVKPVCLLCHGDKDGIPAGVKARLATEYPIDQATGYQQGELRGAVSIKQPMDIPLR